MHKKRGALRSLAGLALALALLAVEPARAFSPNNLFITAADGIYESDPLGEVFLRIIDATGIIQPCFTPRGTLLVVAGAKIVEYDANGATRTVIDLGQALGLTPTSMVPGQAGHLFVGTEQGVIVELGADGTIFNSFTPEILSVTGRNQPCWWFPRGSLGLHVDNLLVEIDTKTGAVVDRMELNEPIDSATLHPASGHLFVTVAGALLEIDFDAKKLVNRFEIFGRNQPCWEHPRWLPNGNLALVERVLQGDPIPPPNAVAPNAAILADIIEVDVAAGAIVRELGFGIPRPTGLAVGPFRFEVKLSGELTEPGLGITKFGEVATLTLWPGSGLFGLVLDDGANGLVGPMFNTGLVMFTGYDLPVDTKRRTLSGLQVPRRATTEPAASAVLRVRGFHGENSFFYPERLRGDFHLSNPLGGILKARIK